MNQNILGFKAARICDVIKQHLQTNKDNVKKGNVLWKFSPE